MKGKSGRRAATIEAREEAGVIGVALKKPLGIFAYWKRLSERFVNVVVTVYLLPVTEELPEWEEASKRKRAWLTPADAAKLIDEPQLASSCKASPKAISRSCSEPSAAAPDPRHIAAFHARRLPCSSIILIHWHSRFGRLFLSAMNSRSGKRTVHSRRSSLVSR